MFNRAGLVEGDSAREGGRGGGGSSDNNNDGLLGLPSQLFGGDGTSTTRTQGNRVVSRFVSRGQL